MPVFDRAQVTAGEHATPLDPPVEPLSGDSHQHLLEPLADRIDLLLKRYRSVQTKHSPNQ